MSHAFRISMDEAQQIGLLERAPRAKPGQRLSAEDRFALQMRSHVDRGLVMVRQHQFAKVVLGRKWAFDFAFPRYLVAVEIDGVCVRRLAGVLVVGGRHGTITGIRGDNEKLNAAAELGWSVLRFLQTDVKPRRALETTLRVLAARGWQQR